VRIFATETRFGLVGVGQKRVGGDYKSAWKMEVAHVSSFHVLAVYLTSQISGWIRERQTPENFLPRRAMFDGFLPHCAINFNEATSICIEKGLRDFRTIRPSKISLLFSRMS